MVDPNMKNCECPECGERCDGLITYDGSFMCAECAEHFFTEDQYNDFLDQEAERDL